MTLTALSKAERDALPDGLFAIEAKRVLPLHDERHVRMAWGQVDRMQGLSADDRAAARKRILHAARHFELDTRDWPQHAIAYQLEAMSLAVPEMDDHPNRMPFAGILTRLDQPSDAPPGGSNGRRTIISSAVAAAALPSLLGMAVDYTPELNGHDKKSKIGVITEATIDGNAIRIAGFLYASDFPEECARIQREKDRLGFSYECLAAISDLDADPWVVTRCTFTGAAVLYKHLAAYTTTSLAAQADKEHDMTPEELAAAIALALKPITASIEQLTAKVNGVEKTTLEAAAARDKAKTQADGLRTQATSLEAAGNAGAGAQLRKMADDIEAGRAPTVAVAASAPTADPETVKQLAEMKTALDSATTVIKDLQAKAAATSTAPERKTLPAEITLLLSKHSLSAAADGKLDIAAVDKALAGLPTAQRIEQKLKLQAAGVLA